MEHKFTVIWRPLEEAEYRYDYVTVPDRRYETVMVAAAQQYVDEIEFAEDETPFSARNIIYGEDDSMPTGYDFISILDGHIPEARLER